MHDLDDITGMIIHAALRIHTALGPGLFEVVYERVLARDLVRRGLRVQRQKRVAFEFEGMYFMHGFRADLVVEDAVVVEVKSVTELGRIHARQLLTYLRLLDCRLGLVLNFGALHLRDGIKRVINDPAKSPLTASLRSVAIPPEDEPRAPPAPPHAPLDGAAGQESQ